MNDIDRAIIISVTGHAGQMDKSGRPYIFHPMHVMHKLKEKNFDERFLIVAVLHDVVEDTKGKKNEITIEDLSYDFSYEIVAAVSALTHDKEKHSYEEYVEIVAQNDIAREVKIEDLRHNLDVSRRVFGDWSIDSQESFSRRLIKYMKAYDRLVGGQLNK
jgi:(p)ppGpp synthase/HD superfamily hydrolase